MIEHLRIPTDAGTFDGIASGPEDGRPVLFLHGFPEAAVQWNDQVDTLGAAGCRAVAPDQRGYSPDVRPEAVQDYRLDELVADVLRIADHFGWRRFDLVGHDWGAAVAWATAGEHPDRIRTLTAVSVPHPTPFARAIREDEDQAGRSSYIQLFRQTRTAERKLLADDAEGLRRIYDWKVSPTRVDDYIGRLSEPGALTAALNWYRATKLSTMDVPVITVPTLYVWGTEDVAVGSAAAMATEKYVDAPYQFEMLEDVSHWVTEQESDTLTALLIRHLVEHPETDDDLG